MTAVGCRCARIHFVLGAWNKHPLFCRCCGRRLARGRGGALQPAVPELVGAPQPAATPPPAGHLMTGGDEGPGVAVMVRLIRPTARRTTTSFSTSRLDSSSLLVRSLPPRDPWCGCFWISFSMASYSFSKATYFLLLSAFVCVVAHPCGVKSHGGALLTAVCITSHQSARASW